MIPTTVARVPEHTAEHVNEDIRRRTQEDIARITAQGPEAIDRRLEELDRERDIERLLEANASTLSLIGLGLGRFVDRRFALRPAAVGSLLQHPLQGWCPPMPNFRRLGGRTAGEIEVERYALKTLRGDFPGVGKGDGRDPAGVSKAHQAVRD